MKLSEQQVHSSPCIQITGTRGLVSSACATLARAGRAKPHAGGGERTEFGEAPAGDPLPADHLVKCLGGSHEAPPVPSFFATPDPTGG